MESWPTMLDTFFAMGGDTSPLTFDGPTTHPTLVVSPSPAPVTATDMSERLGMQKLHMDSPTPSSFRTYQPIRRELLAQDYVAMSLSPHLPKPTKPHHLPPNGIDPRTSHLTYDTVATQNPYGCRYPTAAADAIDFLGLGASTSSSMPHNPEHRWSALAYNSSMFCSISDPTTSATPNQAESELFPMFDIFDTSGTDSPYSSSASLPSSSYHSVTQSRYVPSPAPSTLSSNLSSRPSSPSSSTSAPSKPAVATEKRCSHCKTTSTPLWRRDPRTREPLCNACGLYLQQRNRLRPQILIDADADIDEDEEDGYDSLAPRCSHCQTRRTSVWRRGKDGAQLCNACGVYQRLRGKDRPLTLRSRRIRPRSKYPPK